MKLAAIFYIITLSWIVTIPFETTYAQVPGENVGQNIEAPPTEVKRKTKTKRKRRRKKVADPRIESQEPVSRSDFYQEAPDSSSMWLPSWQTPKFDWHLGPIIGFKYQSVAQERTSTRTVQSEIGAAGGLEAVPLVDDNPGTFLDTGAGYAMGRIDGTRKYDETDKSEDISFRYDRLYAGMNLSFYYKWYRHTLGINGGRKIFYQEDDSIEGAPPNIFSASIVNDFGVLALPFLSTHYTHTYRQTHYGGFDTGPFLREYDNWLHSRLFTNFLNFYIDVGPGVTNTTEILNQGEPDETELIGRVDYLKMLAGLHLFWKLGANGHAKYVFNSTENQLGQNSKILLPDQNLYETPRVVMPEDSFVASTFLGASDVLFGFGLGWQYNIQILNLSKKNDRERETTQDNGLAVTYAASF